MVCLGFGKEPQGRMLSGLVFFMVFRNIKPSKKQKPLGVLRSGTFFFVFLFFLLWFNQLKIRKEDGTAGADEVG